MLTNTRLQLVAYSSSSLARPKSLFSNQSFLFILFYESKELFFYSRITSSFELLTTFGLLEALICLNGESLDSSAFLPSLGVVGTEPFPSSSSLRELDKSTYGIGVSPQSLLILAANESFITSSSFVYFVNVSL